MHGIIGGAHMCHDQRCYLDRTVCDGAEHGCWIVTLAFAKVRNTLNQSLSLCAGGVT